MRVRARRKMVTTVTPTPRTPTVAMAGAPSATGTLEDVRWTNRFTEVMGDACGPAAGPGTVMRDVGKGVLFSRVAPVAPGVDEGGAAMLAWSADVAELVGVGGEADGARPGLAAVLGGFRTLGGMDPYAACYGGHQFGHWAGQLGDGRALVLGEVERGWELQLKGAGLTPYSRHADGRAVLRSSVREYVASEAMAALRVPTTRALSLVATNAGVVRDLFYDGNPRVEPGAVVCRVAPSFLRFGSFEILLARKEPELSARLCAFALENYAWDGGVAGATPRGGDAAAARSAEVASMSPPARAEALLERATRATAEMCARWMAVGFVHGVLNTDNMSLLGLTLDYGPYGFVDRYDLAFTPNSSDTSGRYALGEQPGVCLWNLLRLANALVPAGLEVEAAQRVLDAYQGHFQAAFDNLYAEKLGIDAWGEGDGTILDELLGLMMASGADYTNTFRALGELQAAPEGSVPEAFRSATCPPAKGCGAWQPTTDAGELQARWDAWVAKYRARVTAQGGDEQARRARMDAANPWVVPRNWLLQRAIKALERDDGTVDLSGRKALDELMALLTNPFSKPASFDGMLFDDYDARPPEWAFQRGVYQNSCSS